MFVLILVILAACNGALINNKMLDMGYRGENWKNTQKFFIRDVECVAYRYIYPPEYMLFGTQLEIAEEHREDIITHHINMNPMLFTVMDVWLLFVTVRRRTTADAVCPVNNEHAMLNIIRPYDIRPKYLQLVCDIIQKDTYFVFAEWLATKHIAYQLRGINCTMPYKPDIFGAYKGHYRSAMLNMELLASSHHSLFVNYGYGDLLGWTKLSNTSSGYQLSDIFDVWTRYRSRINKNNEMDIVSIHK